MSHVEQICPFLMLLSNFTNGHSVSLSQHTWHTFFITVVVCRASLGSHYHHLV